jgi:spore coat assembly protein SafA
MIKKKIGLFLLTAATGLTVAATSAFAATYTVQPGDYLWKIATEHGITVQQLMDLNQLRDYSIYPNQVLQVPDNKSVYIVQPGDTLWKISQKLGIDLLVLLNANPQLDNPNNIYSGLSINVPEQPDRFLNGKFPLAKGTYQPYTNSYAETRSWTPQGYVTRSHSGVDIMAAKGTPIYSALDGKIVNFGWNQYGGWRITVKVDDTTAFYYAHMSKYAPGMRMGAEVKRGQLIGFVGSTGYGPEGTEGNFVNHLHLGIYKTNTSPWSTVDPYLYLRWWELQP